MNNKRVWQYFIRPELWDAFHSIEHIAEVYYGLPEGTAITEVCGRIMKDITELKALIAHKEGGD